MRRGMGSSPPLTVARTCSSTTRRSPATASSRSRRARRSSSRRSTGQRAPRRRASSPSSRVRAAGSPRPSHRPSTSERLEGTSLWANHVGGSGDRGGSAAWASSVVHVHRDAGPEVTRFDGDEVDGTAELGYEQTLEALLSLIGRPVLVLFSGADG